MRQPYFSAGCLHLIVPVPKYTPSFFVGKANVEMKCFSINEMLSFPFEKPIGHSLPKVYRILRGATGGVDLVGQVL